MKKIVVVSLVFLVGCGLFALDYGVVVDSRGSLALQEEGDPDFSPREKVAVWAENSWVSGDTLYTLSGNFYYLFNESEQHIFEPDLLKIGIKQKNFLNTDTVLDASLGRFSFSDKTGFVLSHVADGVRGRFDLGGYAVTAAAGYTGLLTKPEANVSMTISDVVDDNDSGVYFAPKRVFEQFRIEMPALDRNKSYTLEGLVQQDLRDSSDTMDSLHLTAAAEGGIVENLFFDLSATSAMDTENGGSGILLNAGIYYSLEEFYFSRISGGILWGSVDFFSVSKPTLGAIYSPSLADTSRIRLEYSLRPWADRMSPAMRNMQFIFGGDYFSTSGEYTGTEISGKVRMRPASDFGAGLTLAGYFPDQGVVQGLVRLDVSIGL